MTSVSSRSGRRGRRAVSEINVVPYIDVMLVLLVIFMVTAPMQPPGQIDLPTAGRSTAPTKGYIDLQIAANGDLQLRMVNTGDGSRRQVTRRELPDALREFGAGPEMPVAISADKSVRYEVVVDVLDELKQRGIRAALMVKPKS